MPVYLYRDLGTNETFEVSQSIDEPHLTHSPHTGNPVKRVIQPVPAVYVGSGWTKQAKVGEKKT